VNASAGFLRQHHYFTGLGQHLRDEQKQINFHFLLERGQECCPEVNWFNGVDYFLSEKVGREFPLNIYFVNTP